MLGIVAFLGFTIVNSLNTTYQKMNILEIAQKDVEELRIKNLELILEKEKVQSDEYLEAEARNKLKYSKDGEVAYVIPEEILNSDIISQQLVEAKGKKSDDDIRSSKDLVEIWYNFLFVAGL
jgi:cell division protein FtsB